MFTLNCGIAHANLLMNPSSYLYEKGNKHYENGDFAKAISKYKEYLEKNPNSVLSVSAELNIGMSYYYMDDYVNAFNTLSEINIRDDEIKTYILDILKECKEKAGDEIKAIAQEKQQASMQTAQTGQGNEIKISVIDAYLDDFDELVIVGQTSLTADVFINENKINSQNNRFESTLSWKRGERVVIEARDKDGNSGVLDFFPDSEPPDPPDRLFVSSSSSNSMEVRWDDNEEDDIKGYRLYYRRRGGSWIEVRELIEDTDYEVVGLSNKVSPTERRIQFQLKAVDKMNNESDPSDILEEELPL